MSVLDDLRSVERRVVERLAELEPLVREYNELLAEAKRHNLTPGAADGSAVRPRRRRAQAAGAPTTRRSAATAKRRTRAGRRQRREQVLELVTQRPGITVSQLGKELNVDPTSLYRVVNGLHRDEQITKTGRELRPA